MIKKLTKHGNSSAIIIDKPILDLLNIHADTEISITTNGTSIILTPVKEGFQAKISDNPALQKAFEKIMKEYAPVFEKLAKN